MMGTLHPSLSLTVTSIKVKSQILVKYLLVVIIQKHGDLDKS